MTASLPAHQRPKSGQERPVCQVVCPQSWVGQTMQEELAGSCWEIAADNGLVPNPQLSQAQAVWIAPGLLIAYNAWLQARGQAALNLHGPCPSWLADIPSKLSGRAVLCSPVSSIRQWSKLPEPLGQAPWSQLAGGRVSAFRAARRNLTQLQADLAEAPEHSSIQLSSQLEGIAEEWRVVLAQGQAVAASGYCLHYPAGSATIISVFDRAHFHPDSRSRVLAKAQEVVEVSGLSNATLDLAITESNQGRQVVVLETNPLWCSAPYRYGRQGMENFLDALRADQSCPARSEGGAVDFQPDPWMVQEFAHRYRAFWRAGLPTSADS